MYLFTLGGVAVGWIVDIILVATGMFLDKEGHIIRLPGHSNQESNIRPHSVKTCEVPKHVEKPQKAGENQTVKSTLFSDIVVSGEMEKKQEIPANPRPSEQDTFSGKHSFW